MWLKNESVAAKRSVTLEVYESDGITPAPTATQFQAVAASLTLSGFDSGALTGAVLTLVTKGATGNSITLTLASGGSGAGTLSGGPTNYTFTFQSGVTTVNNFIAATSAIFTVGGTFTGTNTLGAGDVFSSHTFSGGQDSVVFVRPTGGSWATALGTLTNTGIVGHFEYVATQAETNVDCASWDVRIGAPNASNQFTIGAITFNTTIETVECRLGSWDDLEEGSYTHSDMARAKTALLMGRVANFLTNALAFLSLDGTKTRVSGTTDTTGRNANPTIGDLTGP